MTVMELSSVSMSRQKVQKKKSLDRDAAVLNSTISKVFPCLDGTRPKEVMIQDWKALVLHDLASAATPPPPLSGVHGRCPGLPPHLVAFSSPASTLARFAVAAIKRSSLSARALITCRVPLVLAAAAGQLRTHSSSSL